VRGCLHEFDSRRVPLTRRYAPTSPRKRGEVKRIRYSVFKQPKNFPRHALPGFCIFVCSLREQRAQGRPGAGGTRRSRVPEHTGIPHAEAHGPNATGTAEASRPSPRDVWRLIRDLLGERRFLPPSRSGPYHPLDATVAAPGPHDFAVRCCVSSGTEAPDAASVHRNPRHVSMTNAQTSLWRLGLSSLILLICGNVKRCFGKIVERTPTSPVSLRTQGPITTELCC
jgi:hypothetical protein